MNRRTLTLTCGLALTAAATGLRADTIDAYVEAQRQAQHVPGLSIAVVRDGHVIKAQGYGLSNVELDVPASAKTIYQSGSVGKQFAATAVMMLVEEGKLSLDDRISRFLPDVPPSWQDITVRHLLSHTSGIPEYTEKVDLRKDYTEDELYRFAASAPLDFAPGEKWSYSNAGYVLVGIIIRKVTGRFYGDVLHDRIFAPLGMDTARVISEADIVPNRSAGYRLVDGALKNQEWVAPMLNTTADGALYLSVLDMAKWDAALYTERLLKQSSLRTMWTPARLNDGQPAGGYDEGMSYGFGWALGTQAGHKKIEHGGSWQGFKTHIARYVDDRLTVIVMANLAEAKPGIIAHGIAGVVEPALKVPEPAK
jgi:CubicO group peptidase (beta-lactamase class C family)